MRHTMKLAFSCVTVALCVCVMLLSGVINTLSYACAAISGLLIFLIAVEFGQSYGIMSFFVASILTFLLSADKSVALSFFVLFGYYPILKIYIDRMKNSILRIVIKLLLFNTVAIALFFILTLIFNVSTDEFTVFGIYIPQILLLIGNAVFLLYDFAVGKLILENKDKIHALLKRYLKF